MPVWLPFTPELMKFMKLLSGGHDHGLHCYHGPMKLKSPILTTPDQSCLRLYPNPALPYHKFHGEFSKPADPIKLEGCIILVYKKMLSWSLAPPTPLSHMTVGLLSLTSPSSLPPASKLSTVSSEIPCPDNPTTLSPISAQMLPPFPGLN